MRRIFFYLLAALPVFGIGSFFVFKFYFNADTKNDLSAKRIDWIEKTISQIETENKGFNELVNAKDGDLVTLQGYIDQKFLCLDITEEQQNICTTVLIGNSTENKSALIRLQVCNEQIESDCIFWKYDNICSDDDRCSDKMQFRDKDSKLVDTAGYYQDNEGRKIHYYKNTQLKVIGKVSVIDNKAFLSIPIEKLEAVESE